MELSQRRARLIARLRAGRTREKEAAVLVEGVRAVQEAIESGAVVSFFVTSDRLVRSEAGRILDERLGGADRAHVTDEELAELADTEQPQGIVAVCEEPRRQLTSVRRGGRYLVLDGVQDPGNAGTLVRAAVAFGVDGVIALDGTVDLWGAKTVRASAGMAFRIPVVRARAADALARLREVEVPVLVAGTGGSSARRVGGGAGFALVVGNEGSGVREACRAAAGHVVTVGMRGPAESLNVAMAGSILLYILTEEEAG